jgi:hypothetical protein
VVVVVVQVDIPGSFDGPHSGDLRQNNLIRMWSELALDWPRQLAANFTMPSPAIIRGSYCRYVIPQDHLHSSSALCGALFFCKWSFEMERNHHHLPRD